MTLRESLIVCTHCRGDAKRTVPAGGYTDLEGRFVGDYEAVVWECQWCRGSGIELCADCDGEAMTYQGEDALCSVCASLRREAEAA